jgi:endonuclease I
LAVAAAVILLARGLAWADAYNPPANYYSSATGTGATLKTQLRTIISDMDGVNYGDARYSPEFTDADPNVVGNILLIYNRASMSAEWNENNTLPWNREHIWPRSFLGVSSPSNTTTNIATDQFNLRPADTDINNARDNKPFGLDNAAGSYGPQGATFYYPGDADAGDVARAMFYMATRYSQLSLVELGGDPSGLQMGDLSSLIVYHFKDAPDAFERRRNHAIYGFAGENSPAITNPYRQENRNPFVDHPEFVWSIFVGNTNDSRISIAGATVGGDGGSTRNVDLGSVFAGGAVPAAQNFTLDKTGNNGTYYEVTTAGAATSSLSGRLNAFRTNQIDSKSITVGLNTSTATAGLKNGTVTIDNLDITTGGGAGRGANDANDVFNVSLAVLDHATPSFVAGLVEDELSFNFGSIAMGSTSPTFQFDVFNFATTPIYTADLDFDSIMSTGDASNFATSLAAAAGSLTLGAGAGQGFMAMLDTSAIGMFEATYTLMFSDEDLPGALTKSLTLTLFGEVEAALLFGDYNLDGVVDSADYTVWRNALGTSVDAEYDGADGDGDTLIGAGDYTVWKSNYGMTAPASGGGGLGAVGVPEPSGGLLATIALLAIGRVRRR